MNDKDNLPYHAAQALENPAIKYVFEQLEADAMDRLLNVPGWRQAVKDEKRRQILDELKAVRRVRDELELLKAQGNVRERKRHTA